MYLWWSLCTLYLHACQVRVTLGDSGLWFINSTRGTPDMLLVEFMYLVFTCMPGESYRRVTVGNSGSLLLYLCYVFRAPINSLVLIPYYRKSQLLKRPSSRKDRDTDTQYSALVIINMQSRSRGYRQLE